MLIRLVALFLLFPTLTSYPQVIDARLCTPGTQPIVTHQVQYVRSTIPLSLLQVQQDTFQKQFISFPKKSLVFVGYDPYYYWFRFYISNPEQAPRNLYLLMGHIGQDNAILYRRNNGRCDTIGKTGNQYSFAQRPYPNIHTLYPLQVRPRSVDTFYMYMDYGHNYKTFGFALVGQRRLHYIETIEYLGFGLMTGVLLLFAVFNIYLYFWLKEKIHMWYCLYILWLIFLLFKYEGFDEQFFPLDTELANRLTPIMAIGAITIFFLLHLVQQFLSNIRPPNRLFTITTILKYNLLLAAAVHTACFALQAGLLPEKLSFEYANKSTAAGIVLVLVNCIASYRKKFKPALFILCGTCVFLLGGLEKVLFLDEPSYIFPPSLFEVGMVLEAGIISFGLMYRYNLYRKEKNQMAYLLQQEQMMASDRVLEAQHAEQKRIAEDLHDEIGGDLAAIKTSLQNAKLHTEPQILLALDNTAQKLRRIAHNLMPSDFVNHSLAEVLSDHYARLSNESPVHFQFLITGRPHLNSKRIEITLYRIALELTNNILKHASATEATTQLIYNEDSLELVVEDNGKGLGHRKATGIGLQNVYSRVKYLQGTIHLDSNETGTFIFIQIPYVQAGNQPNSDNTGR
jgi:signal transduction histidine kinase